MPCYSIIIKSFTSYSLVFPPSTYQYYIHTYVFSRVSKYLSSWKSRQLWQVRGHKACHVIMQRAQNSASSLPILHKKIILIIIICCHDNNLWVNRNGELVFHKLITINICLVFAFMFAGFNLLIAGQSHYESHSQMTMSYLRTLGSNSNFFSTLQTIRTIIDSNPLIFL